MNWIIIFWTMIASACLTLAAMHLLIWCKKRTAWASLLFAVTAAGSAGLAFCELWMMEAATPAEFGVALRWLHLPAWIVIVGLVALVRVHLRAGRWWLAWAVYIVRTLSLILNFVFFPNLNYRHITGLRHVSFLGERVALGEGVRNPWMLVGQVTFLLLLVFVVDAMFTVWRRGDRWQARFLSAAIVFFFVAATGQAVLSLWGIYDTPITASLFSMGVVAAMGLDLSAGVLRSVELADELHESEERLSLAAGSARLGLWVWDIGKDEVWMTPEGRALFGFTASERIDPERFMESVHPEDRESTRQAVAQSLLSDVDYEREYRTLLRDGSIHWIGVRGLVERDRSGEAVRVRGVAIEITDRKLAEESLKKSEEFNRTVLASLVHHIAILDPAGTILAVNDAWAKFGQAGGGEGPKVGVGANYLDVCRDSASTGDATAQRTLEGMQSVLQRESEYFELEYRCDTPGGPMWFEMRIVPLKTPEGGAVISHANITQRRRAEREVAQRQQEVAHLSRVAMLGELSGSLAHELNQPLMAILSNAQAAQRFLARSDLNRAELGDILGDIVAADQRAGEVIRRLRLLFRKGEVQLESLDANEIVQEVLKLVGNDFSNRSIAVQTELAPDLPAFQGDRVQLQQVLLNLVTNASDAMAEQAESDRQLLVRTDRTNGDGVRVTVSDSGPGIPAETLKHIFDPFFTTKPQGLGLGLGVCRTILTAHGGQLSAENNLDAGATFHFVLPVKRPSAK
ncbi:MAG: ATP-binding protein [Chthoniobacterales bacterium]